MNHCGWHDINYSGDECSRCVAEERHQAILAQAQESAEDTARAIQESDYRRANPGNYECPFCLYVSLRREASRCPLCHGDVPSDHWARVFAAEEAKAQRKRAREAAEAAEWARNAPVRAEAARAAEAAKEAKERAARIAAIASQRAARIAAIADVFLIFYFAYLVPALVLGARLILQSRTIGESAPLKAELFMILVPVINWLFLVTNLIVNDGRALYFILSVVFLVLGAVGAFFRMAIAGD